jgi:transposase
VGILIDKRVEMAVTSVLNGDKSIEGACKLFEVRYGRVERRVKKAKQAANDQLEAKPMGRPPHLSKKACDELSTEQRAKDLAKDSATSDKVQTIIYEKRKDTARKEKKNVLGVKKSICRKSLTKYRKMILPHAVKSVNVQNKRRLQALTDLPSFISACGVFSSLFSVDLNDNQYTRVRAI